MPKCYLCKSSKEDDLQYGEMLQNENMAVHTFCLYLSSNLSQNGEDDEGFLGFLETDIKREARRVAPLYCCYCRKSGANVGCCKHTCRHSFHFICGLKNGAENQFCGSFESYCHKHLQKSIRKQPGNDTTCVICYDTISTPGQPFNCVSIIEAPCCHNGWFHKLCLQGFAKTAGYFFKCPLCNDAQIFRQKLPKQGIFIPNRDAAWELEPNAFAELLERPNECAATECQCKNGRLHSSSDNPFTYCSTCGSKAMHRKCIPNHAKRFYCADCLVNIQHDSGRESFPAHNDDENDEEIDVCHVDEKEDIELLRAILTPMNGADNKDCSDDEVIQQAPSNSLSSSKLNGGENSQKSQQIDQPVNSCPENARDGQGSKKSENNLRTSRNRRITSTSSSSSLEDVPRVSRKSMRNRRISSSSSTSSSSSLYKQPQVSVTHRRSRTLPESRVIRDSITPEVDVCQTKKNELSKHSKLNEENKGTNPPNRQLIDSTEDSSSEDEIYSEKLRLSHISISDDDECLPSRSLRSNRRPASDDEVEVISLSPKKTENKKNSENDESTDSHVNNKKNKSAERDSAVAELSSSDSDDDPLENFIKILEREKYKSFVAQRTRNRTESERRTSEVARKDNKCSTKQYKEKRTENLEASCIAKRTRHRSISCMEELEKQKSRHRSIHCSKESEKPKCSASSKGRPCRRKTMCSQTSNEKTKQLKKLKNSNEIEIFKMPSQPSCSYEMSQIYDKYQYSDEEGTQELKKLNQATHNLEISCIANRTRKRKIDIMQNIYEEDETSCSSVDTCRTKVTDLKHSYGIRNRSSENSRYIFRGSLKGPIHITEKWPKINYEAAYRSRKQQLGNYYPNNMHNPHVSNRKRV